MQRQRTQKKKSNTVAKVASLTAIGVITTAVSFLGAFTLRDFLQSLFEKFEFGQKIRPWPNCSIRLLSLSRWGVLVALVYVKNAHSIDTSRIAGRKIILAILKKNFSHGSHDEHSCGRSYPHRNTYELPQADLNTLQINQPTTRAGIVLWAIRNQLGPWCFRTL